MPGRIDQPPLALVLRGIEEPGGFSFRAATPTTVLGPFFGAGMLVQGLRFHARGAPQILLGLGLPRPRLVPELAEAVDHRKERLGIHRRPVLGLAGSLRGDRLHPKHMIAFGYVDEHDQLRDAGGIQALVAGPTRITSHPNQFVGQGLRHAPSQRDAKRLGLARFQRDVACQAAGLTITARTVHPAIHRDRGRVDILDSNGDLRESRQIPGSARWLKRDPGPLGGVSRRHPQRGLIPVSFERRVDVAHECRVQREFAIDPDQRQGFHRRLAKYRIPGAAGNADQDDEHDQERTQHR